MLLRITLRVVIVCPLDPLYTVEITASLSTIWNNVHEEVSLKLNPPQIAAESHATAHPSSVLAEFVISVPLISPPILENPIGPVVIAGVKVRWFGSK
jgi:hypothetical protein